MSNEMILLKERAEEHRCLYQLGRITRDEAKKEIMVYIDAVNNKAIELAKKYNQKCKKISFNSFCR